MVLKIVSFNVKFPYEIIKTNKSGSLIKEDFDILLTCFKRYHEINELCRMAKALSDRLS